MLNMEFEYTGKDTPQIDHLAKMGLYNIGGSGHALTRNPKVSLKVRYKVCKEALQTVIFMDRLNAVTSDGKIATRYYHCVVSVPRF